MRFLILFIFLTTNVFANDVSEIKNIVIHKDLKVYDNVIFLDKNDKKINIKEFNGSLLLLNFWATWCEPCKEEMPSLDELSQNKKFRNLEILAVNMERVNVLKVKKFFNDLNIKNLPFFFDRDFSFVKEFKLRGVPTTILINKNNEEFARIIGSFDFEDKQFIKWLSKYD